MSGTFTVEKRDIGPGQCELVIGFGTPAQTPQIVQDAIAAIKDLKLVGGSLLRVNGPTALPVAFAIAHEVGHLYGAIAVYDPKITGYVVCISHDPNYPIGSVIAPDATS
jgi:CRISPR-associated protein Csx3